MKHEKYLSLTTSLSIIIGTAFLTAVLFQSLFYTWKKSKIHRLEQKQFIVDRIIQTGPDRRALPTTYLEELMEISKNNPIHLDLVDCRELENKLYFSPVIASAKVKKIYPSAIYVDYTVRRPFSFVSDFENMVVDEEGYLFPLKPFFTPKRLTEIYLGETNFSPTFIGKHPKFLLAKKILSLMHLSTGFSPFFIERIDVSRAFDLSLGRKEIVIILRLKNQRHLLRLNPKSYAQELGNYINLFPSLIKDEPQQTVVDLRLSNIAYIEEMPI